MKWREREADVLIIVLLVAAIVVILTAFAAHGQTNGRQIIVYDARGNHTQTIVPQSGGTVRVYDSRGNSLGTVTTPPRQRR